MKGWRFPGGWPEPSQGEGQGRAEARGTRGAAYPVGRGHLHHDVDGGAAEVPAVAAHHHGAALAVAQVDGGQQALHEVGQVVALPLEEPRGPPQPPAARRPLVLVRRRLHRQHRDGAALHARAPHAPPPPPQPMGPAAAQGRAGPPGAAQK